MSASTTQGPLVSTVGSSLTYALQEAEGISLSDALQEAEGRMMDLNDEVFEVALKYAFKMGQKFQSLKDEKGRLMEENSSLKHQIEDLKTLYQEEWTALHEKTKTLICAISNKIKAFIQKLELFKEEHKNDTWKTRGIFEFYNTCGRLRGINEYLGELQKWSELTDDHIHESLVPHPAPPPAQGTELTVVPPSRIVSDSVHSVSLIKCTQKISSRVKALEEEIPEIKAKNTALQSRIEVIKEHHIKTMRNFQYLMYLYKAEPTLTQGRLLLKCAIEYTASLAVDAVTQKEELKKLEFKGWLEQSIQIRDEIAVLIPEIEQLSNDIKG